MYITAWKVKLSPNAGKYAPEKPRVRKLFMQCIFLYIIDVVNMLIAYFID